MSIIDLSTVSELTTRQAATLLNVSVRTVQLWVESGVLQAWKTAGGHRRISVGSIQQLLDEKQDKQTPIRRPNTKGPVTVLIVDDDKDTLLLYKMLINNWFPSLQVETAEDGIDALVKIGTIYPNRLLTHSGLICISGGLIVVWEWNT